MPPIEKKKMKSRINSKSKSKSKSATARMGKGKKKRKVEKQPQKVAKTAEEASLSEDYCFVCKDGGLLIVCDHKDCIKSYHPECVGKEESFADTGEDWICDWHSCFVCSKSSRYKCICCPKAVCQCCTRNVGFARLRGQNGLCEECLKLAILVEEGFDVDSDGEKIDFKDRETYEGLFREYWEIINEKEGFTMEDLHSADVQMKKGEKVKSHSRASGSESDEYIVNEEKEASSDDEDSEEAKEHEPVSKPNRPKPSRKGQRKGPAKIEFVGWASKSLLEFLASIGKDTNKQLTQDDVASIIVKYVQENKLFHPEKKKKLICDERLYSVLGRKTVNVYKISDLLEAHFPENLDLSEEEEQELSLEEDNENYFSSRKRNWSSMRSSQQKESDSKKDQIKETKSGDVNEASSLEVSVSPFASVVPKNIKLVYLKKSLVEEMLKQPESFECKLVGSFVRVKSDTVDRKQSHQLLQVTGIERISTVDTKMDVYLKVSCIPKDIPISMLSNDDFTEEECDDLCQKVKSGLLEKPTVVELRNKARILHEDITKHWIARELILLKSRIDLANEKGWRSRLFEYLERREQLESPEEQSRLLKEEPKVIAEIIEFNPTSDESPHKDSPEKSSALQTASKARSEDPSSQGSGNASNVINPSGNASSMENKHEAKRAAGAFTSNNDAKV